MRFQFSNGNQIINRYAADGRKLGTEYFTKLIPVTIPINKDTAWTYSSGLVNQSGTIYIDNKEYNTFNGNSSFAALQRIYNSEGFVGTITATIPNYKYYRRDHLGNNREVWVANTKKTIQRTQYYPSGLPWASNTGDNPGQQERKYNGKEFVEMHGYDTYDYGARGYYPAMGRLTSVDPLAEKHFNMSPYAYCLNNPIKLIDPTGMLEEVYITGNESDAATKQLQSSTSLTLKKDENTGKISATGEAKTDADKKLLTAINDPNVAVNVNATSSNYTENGNWFAGGAFGGSIVTDGKTNATQTVNPGGTEAIDKINEMPNGTSMLHEVLESYIGAKETPGTQAPTFEDVQNKTSNGTSYLNAHNKAMVTDPRFKAPNISRGSDGVYISKFPYNSSIPTTLNPEILLFKFIK